MTNETAEVRQLFPAPGVWEWAIDLHTRLNMSNWMALLELPREGVVHLACTLDVQKVESGNIDFERLPIVDEQGELLPGFSTAWDVDKEVACVIYEGGYDKRVEAVVDAMARIGLSLPESDHQYVADVIPIRR